MALAFHLNNEDILYLELFNHIVACNIRERKLNETTLTTPYIWFMWHLSLCARKLGPRLRLD